VTIHDGHSGGAKSDLKTNRRRQGQKAMDAMRGSSSDSPRDSLSAGQGTNRQDRRIVAVYPGSFDPVHLGHIDIARQAARLADEVIVAVYATPNKSLLFSTEERVALWRVALSETGLTNVRVEPFTGLIVEFARVVGAQEIVRGLRAVTDFEYEFQQALMNRKLAPEVETVMLVTSLRYLFISASLLKDVARLGGDLSDLAPPHVMQALREKFEQQE
jgi:pantetheine-phosphate adenylyltransferase